MPRKQGALISLVSAVALMGAALAPEAAPARAAPQWQDGDTPSTAIVVSIDEPTQRSATSASRVLVRGWAANPASTLGTGVARVDLYLDGGPDQGGQYLGQAHYGRQRADVAESLGGGRFAPSGWDLMVDLPRGPHTLVAIAAPTGSEPAVVVPGVASIRATVGGPAGRTERLCGAGGYCTGVEGGFNRAEGGANVDPSYTGDAYVGYGTFGMGATTPPYGWWDALLPDLMPYLVAYAASAYPGPQWFYGHVPALYDQNLLTSQATLGTLGTLGACAGTRNMLGLGINGIDAVGGYAMGRFPFLPGIGSSTALNSNYLGLTGVSNTGPFGPTSPLSVPFAGSLSINGLYAGGTTGAWNGSVTTLGRFFNGGAIGVGGAGGAFSSSYGGAYPGYSGNVMGDNGFQTGCIQRL